MKALWILSIVFSVIAALVAIAGIAGASGAPQEAAAAGIALCIAIIPYCIARAVTEISRHE